LVRAVLAGSQEAYRVLVGRYGERARRWALSFVRDAARAEEVAQEALVEAYFQLESLRRPAQFGSWLRSIVTHTAISAHRRHRSAAAAELSSATDGLQSHSRYVVPRQYEEVEEGEERCRVRAGLGALPPQYRQVLTLFYYEEFTHEELASRLGRSVPAVKSLLHRAREQLRKEISRDGR
jgi:RNA polymerase sigma-70 factor (ECF subfamily)